MKKSKAKLLLHPVRMQIVAAIGSQKMTAKDIAASLPDVPQTTLYRHINMLVEGGVLNIVEENQIRGTVERVYAFLSPPSLTPEDLQEMSKQELQSAASIFFSAFISDFNHYLDQYSSDTGIDPIADGVEINKVHLHLSNEEFKTMNQKMQEILHTAMENQPSDVRKKRIFSYFFIPATD
jgi:DNA-binding transcriptional ArsR family regulator